MQSDLQKETKIKKKASLLNPSTTVVEQMNIGQRGSFAVIGGPKLGFSFKVKPDEKIVIGNSPHANIQITGRGISRSHCVIYWSNNKVFVEDLKSSNGTSVNKQKIKQATEIKKGDSISIGATTEIKSN